MGEESYILPILNLNFVLMLGAHTYSVVNKYLWCVLLPSAYICAAPNVIKSTISRCVAPLCHFVYNLAFHGEINGRHMVFPPHYTINDNYLIVVIFIIKIINIFSHGNTGYRFKIGKIYLLKGDWISQQWAVYQWDEWFCFIFYCCSVLPPHTLLNQSIQMSGLQPRGFPFNSERVQI